MNCCKGRGPEHLDKDLIRNQVKECKHARQQGQLRRTLHQIYEDAKKANQKNKWQRVKQERHDLRLTLRIPIKEESTYKEMVHAVLEPLCSYTEASRGEGGEA